jgi:DNA-binding MarR family transcriptional regulator
MAPSSPSPDCRAANPAADRAPTAAEVVEALVGVVHLMQRFGDARLARCDLPIKLTGSRLRVLFAIDRAGSLRMGDLAADLRVAARTVTDLVAGLEKEGLLTRRPDPADGRATLLELSPAARAHFARVGKLRAELSEEILAPLDGDERRQLMVLLRRLTEGAIRDADGRPWCGDPSASAGTPRQAGEASPN